MITDFIAHVETYSLAPAERILDLCHPGGVGNAGFIVATSLFTRFESIGTIVRGPKRRIVKGDNQKCFNQGLTFVYQKLRLKKNTLQILYSSGRCGFAHVGLPLRQTKAGNKMSLTICDDSSQPSFPHIDSNSVTVNLRAMVTDIRQALPRLQASFGNDHNRQAIAAQYCSFDVRVFVPSLVMNATIGKPQVIVSGSTLP